MGMLSQNYVYEYGSHKLYTVITYCHHNWIQLKIG